ncbi:FAD-dependent monooxygenase [Streptomyces sp. NBC_01594]|uniref:FAD-dependent monooxygenase n=1 Tax=Streptomyces sp. NBC_01594 TaxID=2975890 RepID=UPI003868B040
MNDSATRTPPPDEQVVIVGAGPVGLWLAGELQLAGVPTTVLERTLTRVPHSKALGIHARTIEVLAMRGAEGQFLAKGRKVPNWHFGMLSSRIDLGVLNTPYPYMLGHPQTHTEAILEERALALGGTVLRGHAVTSLEQDASAVTLKVTGPSGPYTCRAGYVVGCDGAGSTVRKAAGIAFPGTDARVFGILGDVVLQDPPPGGQFQAFNANGALIVVPLPGGFYRVTGFDPLHQQPATSLTLDDLRAWATRVAGTDFGMTDPQWISRFGNATRQAATYRAGRVLLAGDAAHMHFPAGGVGLNVGVQDAMNLGWKLAAKIQGRASAELLDSYHRERHPVGVALAEHTLAQTALLGSTLPETLALRDLLSKLVSTQPGLSAGLAGILSALDISYPSAHSQAHPLTGTRAVPTSTADGSRPLLFDLLHDGRPLVLNLSGDPLPGTHRLTRQLGFHITSMATIDASDPLWAGVQTAIIRPDGHVWWATDTGKDQQADLDNTVQHALKGLCVSFAPLK